MSYDAPWNRIPEGDVTDRLRVLSCQGQDRLFYPLDAGDFVFSIQASRAHSSIPAAAAPAAEVDAWEVAIFNADGRLLQETDPELACLPHEWIRYWRSGIGRFVPTAVIRVLIDRCAFGPENYDRFVLLDGD
jgi:hypothetical protein